MSSTIVKINLHWPTKCADCGERLAEDDEAYMEIDKATQQKTIFCTSCGEDQL